MSVQAVLLLGGKGTRLGLTDIPKPMVMVDGVPLLDRTLAALAAAGVERVLALTGHLSNVIENHVADGSRWGLDVTYMREETPRGTAGALRDAADHLEATFLLVYGDVLFNLDLARFIAAGKANGGLGTLFVHPNDHPTDSDLVVMDGQGRVKAFHPKPHPSGLLVRNRANAALHFFDKAIVHWIEESQEAVDLGRDVLPRAARFGAKLHAYNSAEYIKDIGTPERLARAEAALRAGEVAAKSYSNRQRAVFIDRDGVINREVDGITRPDDLDVLPGVAAAIGALNRSTFLAIVATNQPLIAKGFATEGEVDAVHAALDNALAEEGAYLDDLMMCPHHPESGHDGEVEILKVVCQCRKPQPGMLFEAAARHNIDLERSFMIGDRASDWEAAEAAGVTTLLVARDQVFGADPRVSHTSLGEAVAHILSLPHAGAASKAFLEINA
ncbi:MAG: HAD-IIIA family hydrolase [Devosia sp.]